MEDRPGYCVPSWDKYCPLTTTKTSTTTQTTTTTARTTTTTKFVEPIVTAPPITDIVGDAILILHDDKAMLHNWPKNQAPVFHPLQTSFTDPRSVWNQNDFWPHESCAVQFKGESYLIGGAYNCDSGNSNCQHINVQRAVVKLSRTSCGLETVWDGHATNEKLPFDMSLHSCAVFNKRIQNTNNEFKEHVMICSPHDVANDPVNEKEYIDRRCWSTASMEKNSMYWQREASLKTRHINGAMVQHKGRLTMVGGTGSYGGQDSALDTASVEFLDQNLQLNEDNTLNRWLYGKKYPFAVEEHEIVSVRDGYLYVFGGLNYAEYVTDPTLDSAHYNTNKVFKNLDPSQNHEWLPHGDMLKPRANHNSVFFGDQVYHIAGYAKTFNADGSTADNTGRRVEKWESLDAPMTDKFESEQELFRFTAPESFIVKEEWYKTYCKRN